MQRLFGLTSLLLLCVSGSLALGNDYVGGEILIRYTAQTNEARIDEIQTEHSLTLIQSFQLTPVRHYALPIGMSVQKTVMELAGVPEIVFAEPNAIRTTMGVPSDSRFSEQWSLDNTGQSVNGLAGVANADIDLPEALDLYSGSSEVIVAVIDSGVALSHPEFGAGTQWWVNDDEIADNGMDDDGNGYIDDRYGWDFVDDDPNPLDENGHGTQMASLIAASQDDGEAIAGIAPHARIMALRVFENTGGATTASILAALEYAGQNGAQLVTLSMGRDGFSEAEAAQFEALDALGVLCVIAAGNGGADGESDDNDVTPTYPASYASENIISVAATDESDELASFSNFGLVSVDLAAPGENILGADVTRELFSQETFDSGTLGWSYDCDGTCTNQNTWQYIFPGIPGINNWATDSYTQAGFFFDDWDYLPDTVVDFNSPALPMPVAGAGLEFRIWQQLAAGDSLLAEGSGDGGTTWSLLPGLPPFVEGGSELPTPNESPTTGSVVSADLSEFDALPSAKLRFRLVSDGEAEATGIFIDDVTITQVAALDPENPNYAFVSGTSSSATIVSGIAALVMSERPDLTHREVREVVLSSVDTLPSLAGKVATGGRVNARAAVAAAQAFPAPEPSTVAMAIAALVSLAGLRTARRRAH